MQKKAGVMETTRKFLVFSWSCVIIWSKFSVYWLVLENILCVPLYCLSFAISWFISLNMQKWIELIFSFFFFFFYKKWPSDKFVIFDTYFFILKFANKMSTKNRHENQTDSTSTHNNTFICIPKNTIFLFLHRLLAALNFSFASTEFPSFFHFH